MAPDTRLFENLDQGFRALAWPNHEYVLGTNKARAGIIAKLPAGDWTVTRHDVIAKTSDVLARDARGRFPFDAPASRAVLFHWRRSEQ